MHKAILPLLLTILATPLAAAEAVFPRYPAPSPDSSQIAFSWQGDIWVVSAAGGPARRLTIHAAYDHSPKWSPDGSQIAFASNRWGNDDIFVMAAEGGTPQRLTWHSGTDSLYGFAPDGQSVLFSARRGFTRHRLSEMYAANLAGGTPRRVADVLGFQPTLSANGDLAFVRGSSAKYRLRYRGAANRDIWVHSQGATTQLTDHQGDDEWPLWAGDTVWFASHRDGTPNLWSVAASGGTPRQRTTFTGEGIRDPAISQDGSLIAFERGYAIWTHDTASGTSAPLNIQVPGDALANDAEWRTRTSGASSFSIATDKDALAFVVDGEVWVRDLDRAESHRVTNTPQRESSVVWVDDGNALLYVSDRSGQDQLWLARPTDFEATPREADEWEEFQLTDGPLPASRPTLSPDGKAISYVEDYGTLLIAALDVGAPLEEEPEEPTEEDAAETTEEPPTEAVEEADAEPVPANEPAPEEAAATTEEDAEAEEEEPEPVDERRPPSLGDPTELRTGWDWPWVSWSPDSAWIAWSVEDVEHNSDVWLAKADGTQEPVNLSAHPDYDYYPAWSENGRVLAFSTTRTNDTSDIWYVYLRQSDEDLTARDRKDLWAEEDKTRKEDKPDTWVEIDLEDIQFRLRATTRFDGSETEVLVSPTADRVVFRGTHDGSDLYSIPLTGGSATKITSGHSPSQIRFGPNGDVWYLRAGGTVYSTKATKSQMASHSFSARWRVDRRAERLQVFEEAWRTMERGFYDENHHGADWDAIRERYRPWALGAAHPRDFDAAIDIMLGELNGSHLGYYGRIPSTGESSESTGHLGLILDHSDTGPGLLISRVIPDGPADTEEVSTSPGERLLAINGDPLSDNNLHGLLVDTVGDATTITLQDTEGNERTATLRPTTNFSQRSLLYEEWVDRNRQITATQSDNRLGYVHIRGMNTSSLERFEAELYSVGHGKEGLVIDVRDNGGGWTTDYLLTMLMVRRHAYTHPRGEAPGSFGYPQSRLPMYAWPHPVIVLANQNSYSNAEIFSHAMQTLGRALVVGVPTHGAVISTGSRRLMDGSSMRYPFRGWYTADDMSNMENGPAIPDILVRADLADEIGLTDAQLSRAISALLSDLQDSPSPIPGVGCRGMAAACF